MVKNRSIPSAMVVPVLVYPDVRAAVAWLTEAFGFVERVRIGEDHRSQMRVGDNGAVIIADVRHDKEAPQMGVVTHEILVRVDDVDAQVERARSHGAIVVNEPTDYEYGERQCTIDDFAGHRWLLSQTLRDVAPEDWGGETVQP
ncbi:MAG: glyoxalase [Acidimicrobiia bacterium]|nr:glyoxalase [Acidimicrobiia bacterium]